uniref:Uncharacterized protein n=1 Tax=Megaselia scalaris TaxID=36166 RepID=T1GAK4_MEGSC
MHLPVKIKVATSSPRVFHRTAKWCDSRITPRSEDSFHFHNTEDVPQPQYQRCILPSRHLRTTKTRVQMASPQSF